MSGLAVEDFPGYLSHYGERIHVSFLLATNEFHEP